MIGLLLLLMLIGFAFFTFANQEQSSAEYYADASKGYSLTLPFDFGLEQLIVGPRDNNYQSALWPGKHSLVPNMLGMFEAHPSNNGYPTVPSDRHPYNGGWGINVISGAGGQPYIDQNFDGTADTPMDNTHFLLTLNFSGAAQLSSMGTTQANSRLNIFNNFPPLDVGYTYPDINNVFLAYIGNEPSSNLQVIKPSFHLPMLTRLANGQPNTAWQTDNSGSGSPTDTTTKLLRPHPSHVCVADNTVKRFLSTAVTVGGSNSHTIQYFGYQGLDANGNPYPPAFNSIDSNKDGIYGNQGLWSNNGTTYEYDVDNDQDGTREGIWLDLNYPVQVLLDGRKMIPLFSFTVIEADGLINLNTAGNQSWMPQASGLARPFYGAAPGFATAGPFPISHSNLGMSSPAEINPFWALVADPRNTTVTYVSPANTSAGYGSLGLNGPNGTFGQYRGFFGLSNTNSSSTSGYDFNWIEAANMDMLRLMWGAPKYTISGGGNVQESFTIDDIVAGRWGDVDSLLYGQKFGTPGQQPPPLYDPNTGLILFPKPGYRLFDDDGDQFAGLTDAGYYYTSYQNVSNVALGFNNSPWGGDPTNYLMPYFNNSHQLQTFTRSIFNQSLQPFGPPQAFPTMVAANPGLPNPGYNSPVTLLPFGQ
ncbi:MAG TPA: hypothetical protein VGH74_08885, partial [Planctomycetaceae bacterium]